MKDKGITRFAEPKAAERGNPSFVWRAGQERRLSMLREHVSLRQKRVLDVGCGIGMYTSAFRRYTPHVFGIEIEYERACEAQHHNQRIAISPGERLPFADHVYDVTFSHEVLEHVGDDRACAVEMVRVTRPGGHIVIFVPNRLYFFETHGIYWRGRYRFGNKPLINWLPNYFRNRLAPHVRAYTRSGLRALFAGLPVRERVLVQIYPGYDNVVARRAQLGSVVRSISYFMERTPLRLFGLSHFLVLEVLDKAG
ncbi:MAG: methyltransferase domain-containing protein [Anaerolineae bacterium]|nr:methyltransferase domain-containing protein [Anaerolineae bacterium]